MFPYSNYSDQMNAFQPIPQHMYQNVDFSSNLGPFSNYYYFFHPYYQPNINYAHYFQPTALNDDSSGNFRLYQG